MINIDDHLLLNNYLNSVFSKNSDGVVETVIELIIRPECNQKCEYCYIYKHGHNLYPYHERVDNQTILNNLKAFFNYLLKKKSYLSRIELFAGDLFYDDLFFDIAEILYEYYYKIYQINPNLFNSTHTSNFFFGDSAIIIMPCNCSFCNDKEKIKKFEAIVKKLQSVNATFLISYSSDGLHASDIREKHSLSEEFIDNVFTLMYDYEYGSHPMISYESIDNAIQNYEWWKSQYIKYNRKYDKNDIIIPCMLEVRNEGWTDESIQKYIKFLDYMIEDRLKLCDNNLEHLAFEAFCRDPDNHEYHRFGTIEMSPIMIPYANKRGTYMSCSLGHSICIQCNNLTLVPCHRLSYPFYQGGRFILNENNEIDKLEALNGMHGYLNLIHRNPYYGPKCSICDYRGLCHKGCCGAQFEAMSDPNIPIPDVCKLQQAKTNFLIKKYNDMGVLRIAVDKHYISPEEIISTNKILNILGEKYNG